MHIYIARPWSTNLSALETGIHCHKLDLDGGSHAGFPRNRGVTKKEDAPLSASDLSVYRSTKDPELLKKFCTFNHAVRAKDTPLEEPQVILDQGSRAKASNKVLHAPRVCYIC